MSNQYTSSMTSRYGDAERVKADVKTLNDIINRQGNALLIDVIAESCGETCNAFCLDSTSRMTLVRRLTEGLREALLERV